MIQFIDFVNDEIKIEENFEKLRQRKCNSHNKYKACYFCTNFSCVQNSTSFLCELCYNDHPKNHFNNKEIKSVEDLFSMKRLIQMKEDCKIDPAYQDKINQISQDLDQIFEKLKETLCNMIDEVCKKAKANFHQKFSLDNEYIMKIIKEHEQVLINLFNKDTIITNFNLSINPYLKSFIKISETFRMQIKVVENLDQNIDLFLKNFAKINQKHKDLVDIAQQNISNFDEFYNNLNFTDHQWNNILVENNKEVEINKTIHRLHTDIIYKIISYDNNTKYITCSADNDIIIRNFNDDTIIKILSDHEDAVRDIFLLSDGRLASSSLDKTIKIWNIANSNCEQTLIGHSNWVYCLLELPNSILLSGSKDSSIGIWDISQKDKQKLQFYHQVQNDEQQEAYCMTLISANELAVSSYKDINIYSFDNVTHKFFYIIKTLQGHTDWVHDIKLMINSKDLLVSCSNDRDCRLWSISQENCLKIFKGHSDKIWSIQILSEKIFVSASKEIIFWDIDSIEIMRYIKPDQPKKFIFSLIKSDIKELIIEVTRSIKPDQPRKFIFSLMKNDINQLVFAGGYEFIGLIEI